MIDRTCLSCPINGLPCINGIRKDFQADERTGQKTPCRLWTYVSGKHPQTGEDLNMGDCALAWTPTLIIEAANQSRQAGASVDKLTNVFFKALPGELQKKVALTMGPQQNDAALPHNGSGQ